MDIILNLQFDQYNTFCFRIVKRSVLSSRRGLSTCDMSNKKTLLVSLKCIMKFYDDLEHKKKVEKGHLNNFHKHKKKNDTFTLTIVRFNKDILVIQERKCTAIFFSIDRMHFLYFQILMQWV